MRFFFIILVFSVLMLGCGEDEDEPLTPPPTPTSLEAKLSGKAIKLTWNQVEGASSYSVYRKTEQGSKYQEIKERPKGPVYEDKNVTPNVSYFYRVLALSDDGIESELSTPPLKIEYTESVLIVIDKEKGLDFGSDKDSLVLKIKNDGKRDMKWEISAKDDWFTFEQKSGTLKGKASDVINVKANRSALTPREQPYTSTITVVDQEMGTNVIVPVKIVAPSSDMYVEPTEIKFNELRESHKITVKNSGTGALKWHIEKVKNVQWLNVTPTNGTVQAEDEVKVALTIKVSALQGLEGRQNEAIKVINERQPDNIKSVSVEIEPPRLKVEPSEIEFCKLQSPQTLNVRNVGGCVLNWHAVMDDVPDWLEVKPDSAKTQTGQTQTVTFKINADKMDKFYQVATVKFANIDDSTNESVVTVNIKPPQLDIDLGTDRELVDFGETHASERITVKNTGCAILRWKVSKDKGATWLDITPDNGRFIDEQQSVVLSINPESEELAGEETETLRFVNLDNPDNEKTVSVKAVFTGKPELFISKDNLDFGKSDKEKTIEFKNIGTGVLVWSADIGSSWLQIVPANGEIEDSQFVKISAMRDNLDARDDYNDKINVTSNGGNKTIFVRMSVVGTIDGVVYDAIGDEEVSDAQVTLNDVTVTRTFNGRFSLNYEREGTYRITVEKPGYIPTIMDVQTARGHLSIERLYIRPLPHPAGKVSNANFRAPKRVVFSVDGRTAYVTNELVNYVSVIDAISDSGEHDIPLKCGGLGCSSLGIAVNPHKPELYVANNGSDTVSIIEIDERVDIKQIPCESPTNLAVSPDGNWLYITNNTQKSVSVVSLATRVKKAKPIDVGNEPFDIAISPNGSIYVTNWGGGDVSVIEGENEIATIDAGGWPGAIAISSRYIYIANQKSDDVYVYDSSHNQIGRFPVPSMPTSIAIVEYNDGSEVAYVVSIDGTITLIDMSTQTVLDTTINVDNFAQDIAYNPILRKFYITCASGVVVLEF